jgi:hypothetical protein
LQAEVVGKKIFRHNKIIVRHQFSNGTLPLGKRFRAMQWTMALCEVEGALSSEDLALESTLSLNASFCIPSTLLSSSFDVSDRIP